MTAPFYLLVGHAVVAADGLKASAALTQALSKSGWDKSQAGQATSLGNRGIALLATRREQFEDRLGDHNIHTACTELEMWLQTVRFLLKRVDPDTVSSATGDQIHVHDHVISVIAQTLRSLATLRTSDYALEATGGAKKCHDIAGRGWALLKRLLKTTQIRLAPQPGEDPQVFTDMATLTAELTRWIDAVDLAASTFPEKSVPLLALLGHVPAGVGRPLGGTGLDVLLHQKSQSASPDPLAAFPSTGWSVGRQGRNRENIGNGRIEPSFS